MNTRRQPIVMGVAVAWLATAALAFAQQTGIVVPRQRPPMPPRDTSARPATPVEGTASISGRVVAADSGQPLRRAIVTAQFLSATRGPGGIVQGPGASSARTDDDGRYTLARLPAGEYMLAARRAGYVDSGFGQTARTTPSRRITVADGAAVGPLDFQLLRGGVITGRVTDDAGEPAERVMVRAMRSVRVGGRSRMLNTGDSATTDDLGQFRLFGLPPGDYFVVAEPSGRGRFRPGTDVQGDDLETIATYAPGTVTPADAQRVQVQSGVEAAIDVQLVAARVARVSGRVFTSRGEPLTRGFIRLQTEGPEMFGQGGGGQIQSDGTFEVDGVAPGAYTLYAQAPTRNVESPQQREAMMATMEVGILPIIVEGEDQAGLVVTTSPGSTAKGRLLVDGDASALAGRDVRVMGSPAEPSAMLRMSGPSRGRVAPDQTVEVFGLRGRQVLHVSGLPTGWWIKTVRVGGSDALLGFEFGNGKAFTDLEIIVSAQPSGLAGSVTLPTGAKAEDYAVVLFPEDEDLWQGSTMRSGTRMTRPDLDGTFKMSGLRPGTYYVMAVPVAQADYSVLGDPEQMRQLAQKSRTVEITEGQTQSLQLTLVER